MGVTGYSRRRWRRFGGFSVTDFLPLKIIFRYFQSVFNTAVNKSAVRGGRKWQSLSWRAIA